MAEVGRALADCRTGILACLWPRQFCEGGTEGQREMSVARKPGRLWLVSFVNEGRRDRQKCLSHVNRRGQFSLWRCLPGGFPPLGAGVACSRRARRRPATAPAVR